MPFSLTNLHGSIEKAKTKIGGTSKLSSDAKEKISKEALQFALEIIYHAEQVCLNSKRLIVQKKDIIFATEMFFASSEGRALLKRAPKAKDDTAILAAGKVKQMLRLYLERLQDENVYADTVLQLQDVITNIIIKMIKLAIINARSVRNRATVTVEDVNVARQKVRGC